MVSSDKDSVVARPRKRWWFAPLLFFGSCLLLGGSFYRYAWPGLKRYYAPPRIAQREEQSKRDRYRQGYRRQVDSMVALAIEHVRALGGRCDKQLWKFDEAYYEIDLSQWQGTDADLALLLPFQRFGEDNRLNDPDRFFELTLHANATDASLAYVGDLTNLISLKVAGNAVTDAGLRHLDRLDQIRVLDLSRTLVSDNSVDLLARRESLNRLDVSNTRITAEGIARFVQQRPHKSVIFSGGSAGGRSVRFNKKADPTVLQEILDTGCFLTIAAVPHRFSDADLAIVTSQRNLERLYLTESSVTDSGLQHLSGLTSLSRLSLSDAPVTGSGFEDVDELENLSYLNLAFTRITDTELVHLKKMPKLEKLVLTGTAVTGDGLKHLSGMESLRMLFLRSTGVSFAAAEEWQRRMPAVTIHHSDGILQASEETESASGAGEE